MPDSTDRPKKYQHSGDRKSQNGFWWRIQIALNHKTNLPEIKHPERGLLRTLLTLADEFHVPTDGARPLHASLSVVAAAHGCTTRAVKDMRAPLEESSRVQTDSHEKDGIATRYWFSDEVLRLGLTKREQEALETLPPNDEPPPELTSGEEPRKNLLGTPEESSRGPRKNLPTVPSHPSYSLPEVVARAHAREDDDQPSEQTDQTDGKDPDMNYGFGDRHPLPRTLGPNLSPQDSAAPPLPEPAESPPSRPVVRSDDPEPSPESETDADEYQEAPGASRYQYIAKPVVKKKTNGKFGFGGGQPASQAVHHPTGPIGRVVAHFLQDVPDFHYDPGRCERFRVLLGEWLELEGTVEDVCEMVDTMTQEKVARDGDPPVSLNYFNSTLQAAVKARRAAISKGETGFHAGIRPASEPPEPPKWKQVHVMLDELDAKYGAQANSETYAKTLKAADLAAYVLEDERTFSTVLSRLFRKFPESGREELPYRLRVALGAPPKARKPKPPEPEMQPTTKASEVIAKLSAHFAEVRAETPEEFPPPPVVSKPLEIVGDEVSGLSVKELLTRIDPEIVEGPDGLRAVFESGGDVDMGALRQLARAHSVPTEKPALQEARKEGA